MSNNPFENTGFSAILPRTSQNTYNLLLHGKRQVEANKQYQEQHLKDVEDFNDRTIADLRKIDYSSLDAVHKLTLNGLVTGFLNRSQEIHKLARNEGRKISLEEQQELEDLKMTSYQARDIMAAHQEAIKYINGLVKQNPGLYKDSLFKDATFMMFERNPDGRINTKSPNLDFNYEDIVNLASDQKYINGDKVLDDYVKAQGNATRTKFRSFKDPLSQEMFSSEEDFEYPVAIYGTEPEFNDDGDLMIQDVKAWLVGLDNEAVKNVLEYRAKENGTTQLIEAEKFLQSKGKVRSKGEDISRIPSNTSNSNQKNQTFEVAEVEYRLDNDAALSSGIGLVKGKKWSMPDLVRGMNIQIDGEAQEADFQGIVPTENGYQFEFSRMTSPTTEELAQDPANSEKRLRTFRIPLTDTSTEKSILNALSGNEKKAFQKAMIEAKSAKITKAPINSEVVDSHARTIATLLRNGNYEQLTQELEKIGLKQGSDFQIKRKGLLELPGNRGLNLNGTTYYASDPEKLIDEIVSIVLPNQSSKTPPPPTKPDKGFNPKVASK